MMTQSKVNSEHRDLGLDLLRSLAILSVILYHYPRSPEQLWLRALSHFGWVGVDLFFVLSGYLIGSQTFSVVLKKDQLDFKRFYVRRFLRTWPNYFAVLFGLYYFWDPALFGVATPIWRFISFTQNFGIPVAFSMSWSLCVEEHFYLLFPLIARWLFNRGRKQGMSFLVPCLSASLIFGIVLRSIIWFLTRPDRSLNSDVDLAFTLYLKWFYYPTPMHLDGIFVGIFLGAIRVLRPALWQKLMETSRLYLFLGLAIVGAGFSAVHGAWRMSFVGVSVGFTLLAAGFGCLLIWAVASDFSPRRWGWATPFAQRAFALYLTHVASLELSSRLCSHFSWNQYGWMMCLSGVVIMTALAEILFRLIESPFLRWRDALLRPIIK